MRDYQAALIELSAMHKAVIMRLEDIKTKLTRDQNTENIDGWIQALRRILEETKDFQRP